MTPGLGYGAGLGLTVLGALFLLWVAAYVRWSWHVAYLTPSSGPTKSYRPVIFSVICSAPLVGYFVADFLLSMAPIFFIITIIISSLFAYFLSRLFYHHKMQRWNVAVSSRTFTMPFVGVCAVLNGAILLNLKNAEEYRSWENVTTMLTALVTFYIVAQLIVYMFVSVYGFSRADPLATRAHLATSAAVFLLMV